MKGFVCSICHQFHSASIKRLLKHINFIHSNDPDFNIRCGIDMCEKRFLSFKSFMLHLKRKHSILNSDTSKQIKEINLHNSESENEVETNLFSNSDFSDVDKDEDHNADEDPNYFLVQMILKMKELYKLPKTVTHSLVESFTEMNKRCLINFFEFLKNHQFDLSNKITEEIVNRFLFTSGLQQSFTLINSHFKMQKYIENNMNLIKPVEIILGYNEIGKKHSFQYVPILSSLSTLSHYDVLSYVFRRNSNQLNRMNDFCDGALYKNNTLLSENFPAIQIQLYIDDFTVTNPLSNNVRFQKLTAMYFVLGNIPPKCRSKLYNIQLINLCKSNYIKKYGYQVVLEPLVNDLKLLEQDGIQCTLHGQMYNLKGTVTYVSADNLASHSIGGFLESFNSQRICRFCFISKNNINDTLNHNDCNLRTVNSYQYHVEMVQNDPSLSGVYGIKYSSVLNELKFFHVIHGLPPDIIHDIFEGIVHYILPKILRHLTQSVISLSTLNEKIIKFPYLYADKTDKPSPILDVNNTKQTAAKTWCLMRLLPLIIGKEIPETDAYWELNIILLDLIDIVCAPVQNMASIAHMKTCIDDYFELRFQLFPDITIKPKEHYLLHYPYLTYMFGPLIHCWTMRFEAKHSYFKEISRRTKNNVNICKTLAERHQFLQCYFHSANENFLKEDFISSLNPEKTSMCLLNPQEVNLLQKIGLSLSDTTNTAKHITINGIKYETGCALLYKASSDLVHEFCKIQKIIIMHGLVYFIAQFCYTVGFSKHLHAYIITDEDNFKVIQLSECADYHPYGIYVVDNIQYIVLKYFVVANDDS